MPSRSVSRSEWPQSHLPATLLSGSWGQASKQSGTPSASVSCSDLPQPHMAGATLAGSNGQRSMQFAVPSSSASAEAASQAQVASSSFWSCLRGQKSMQSGVPSPSASSRSLRSQPQMACGDTVAGSSQRIASGMSSQLEASQPEYEPPESGLLLPPPSPDESNATPKRPQPHSQQIASQHKMFSRRVLSGWNPTRMSLLV